MIWIRSGLFSALALIWSIVLMTLYLPLLALPRRWTQRGARVWCQGLITLARLCCGMRYRVIGREQLPKGGAIIAAKHQSAWETLFFHTLLADPIYVLKRELVGVPLIGWYLKKAGNIAIDRAAGFRAIKTMMPSVRRALAEGAQVVVFPEGTRTAPGQHRRYQPGVAALYAATHVPVVPVALNSGLFWGRRRFVKYPGVVTVEFLPPMPAGLDRNRFLAMLEQRIEQATRRLCEEVAVDPQQCQPQPAGGGAPGDEFGDSIVQNREKAVNRPLPLDKSARLSGDKLNET
jgi:1-acyl-sn-glycerol-3-phosphate acyltransferase